MEIKITKDMYSQLLTVVEGFNKWVQEEYQENIFYPLDCELFSAFKKQLGFSKDRSYKSPIYRGNTLKVSEFEISICKSDATEILSCINSAYSQLKKNQEDDYRMSGLPDPEGLTQKILKWMGIECIDKEINKAIDKVVL